MGEQPDDMCQVLAAFGLLLCAAGMEVAGDDREAEGNVAILLKEALQVFSPQGPALGQAVLELDGRAEGKTALVSSAIWCRVGKMRRNTKEERKVIESR